MGSVLATILLAAAAATPSSAPPAPLVGGFPTGWYARVDTTLGSFTIRLLPEQAPQSVAYFAAFAEGRIEWNDPQTGEPRKAPYYDGVPIHKIVFKDHFETGDRTGTGRGGPPQLVPHEFNNPVNFERPYRVGLTRSPGGRVSGAMFFVTIVSAPYYNGRHPCIGEVVDGRSVVEALCSVPADDAGRPLQPPKIEKVTIFKSGEPRPLQEPLPYTHVPPTFGPPRR